MSLDQTQRTMDRYFGAMGRGDDFSTFLTADVTWIMMESGQEVCGPAAVRDYILALHSKMFGHQQRALALAISLNVANKSNSSMRKLPPPSDERTAAVGGTHSTSESLLGLGKSKARQVPTGELWREWLKSHKK
jgi:hypothetical protein